MGFVADSTVSDSYADVAVTSGASVGGLVGFTNNSTVSRSYAIGAVSSQNNERGGLVGIVDNSDNTVSHSFYGETTGQSDTGKGDRKTTAEMKNQATFTNSNWDFDTVWAIDPTTNIGYPYLRANPR